MGRATDIYDLQRKYSYYQQVDEGHNQPVYCVVMNDIDPFLKNVFASVGSNLVGNFKLAIRTIKSYTYAQVTIYRLPEVPDDDIKVEQRYKDEDVM